jgi:hypothetical protein
MLQLTRLTIASLLLLLSVEGPACDKQAKHFPRNEMSARVLSKTPIAIQGNAVRISSGVELLVVVDKKGEPECISVVSGHPLLIPAAIDSVRRWRFEPYVFKGKARKYSGNLVIRPEDFIGNHPGSKH